MHQTLWQPDQALEVIREKGVGQHHVLVRKPSIEAVKSAIWKGAISAYRKGKPLPPPPKLPLMWEGDLSQFGNRFGPNFATAYILEATRIRNHGFRVEQMFTDDGIALSASARTNVFPLVIVTDVSYTKQLLYEGKEPQEDPDFHDPKGPDAIQNKCLDLGVAVWRTTRSQFNQEVEEVMRAIHLGERHPQLILPSSQAYESSTRRAESR